MAPNTFLLVGGMLLSGTIGTTVLKTLQVTEFRTTDGVMEKFSKACTPTLFMFSGEFLCLLFFFGMALWYRYQERRHLLVRRTSSLSSTDSLHKYRTYSALPTKDDKMSDAYLGHDAPSMNQIAASPPATVEPEENEFNIDDIKKANPLVFMGFSLFDLAGTTLATMGLLRTTASVYQMLRGSIVIFTGVLSVLFLKRRLVLSHWLGMAIVISGLILVGSESYLTSSGQDDTSPVDSFLGIILVVGGQFCNAIQFILEELYLKNRKLSPIYVVGMEGIFGAILSVAAFLPICNVIPGNDAGRLENVSDTIAMLSNSWLLVGGCMLYCIAIAVLNMFGMSVTKYLTAVHRTLIDAVRTLIVWVVQIIIFYSVAARHGGESAYGEEWTSYSFMQLIGFLLLVVGTCMYNQILKIPCIAKRELQYVAV